jgi:hypothetical protein
MDFLNISSLGAAYRYAVKMEHKFRHQNKWEFGSTNPQQPKSAQDDPNQQPPYNQSKKHEKKGKTKTKNETGKWCDFQKFMWHNTDEFLSKQSLVAEVKDKEPNLDLEFDLENIENRQIIVADPRCYYRDHNNSTIGTVSNNCGIGVLKGKRAETFRVSKDRWDPSH